MAFNHGVVYLRAGKSRSTEHRLSPIERHRKERKSRDHGVIIQGRFTTNTSAGIDSICVAGRNHCGRAGLFWFMRYRLKSS